MIANRMVSISRVYRQSLLWVWALLFVLGKSLGKPRLALILERDNLKHVDPKYVTVHEHVMQRANRTAPYTYSINVTILLPWHRNVTVEMKGFENHNNEYKESILNFKLDVCELFAKPNFIINTVKPFTNLPSKCPMENNLHAKDLLVREDQIPAFFPQSKWMLQLKAYTTKQKILIIELEIYFQIVNLGAASKKKGKNN